MSKFLNDTNDDAMAMMTPLHFPVTLPNNKILEHFKFEAFPDDDLNMA